MKWIGLGVCAALVVAVAALFAFAGGGPIWAAGGDPGSRVHDGGEVQAEPLYVLDNGTHDNVFDVRPFHHESNVNLRVEDVNGDRVYELWFSPAHQPETLCPVQESRPTYVNVEPRVGAVDVHFRSFPPYNGTWEIRDGAGVVATVAFVLVDDDGAVLGGRDPGPQMNEWECDGNDEDDME